MDSAIIVSDYLGDWAIDVDAPEKNLIFSWSEVSGMTIEEDIVIIDTKLLATRDKSGSKTAIGDETHQTLKFFENSFKNLLESGKTIIALLYVVQDLYKTGSRTEAVQNYRWLRSFGRSTIERGKGDPDKDFIFEYGDARLDPLDMTLTNRSEPLNTYFQNVTGAPVILLPENSPAEEYEKLAVAQYHNGDEATALLVNSWKASNGGQIIPAGKLILLPRPKALRVNGKDWFRSLIQIAHQFTPDSDGIDEFNRVINRTSNPGLRKVYRICHRFPTVARQLENRHSDRDTIEITDEYDVQDLFHGLLKVFFDDIREEENAPSHAGSSPRIDFLIKGETIAIEIKITRDGRSNKELKNELAEDKEHYRTALLKMRYGSTIIASR